MHPISNKAPALSCSMADTMQLLPIRMENEFIFFACCCACCSRQLPMCVCVRCVSVATESFCVSKLLMCDDIQSNDPYPPTHLHVLILCVAHASLLHRSLNMRRERERAQNDQYSVVCCAWCACEWR
jgi:hypothetical protein